METRLQNWAVATLKMLIGTTTSPPDH